MSKYTLKLEKIDKNPAAKNIDTHYSIVN